MWRGVVEEFREWLPLGDARPVTLLEGNTPLIRADNLEKRLRLEFRLWLKYEGANPTGSFKDRGMTVAVTRAVAEGAKAIICASTGNTAASAAAYAARAGLPCIILLPHGAIAEGKLSQALAHGARIVSIDGSFDQGLALVREMAERYGLALVNSINPFRLEGQKTAAFELCSQLGGEPPHYLLLPVGNAGNITAYWKGFCEQYERGAIKRRPRMLGFQARGADPIVRGRPIARPATVATAIRIGNPASWRNAERARDESGGTIAPVTDREILSAYRLLASTEGVFVEPASAASLAGLIKLNKRNYFQRGTNAVCVLTGHGLKDPETALRLAPRLRPVAPTLASVARAVGLSGVRDL